MTVKGWKVQQIVVVDEADVRMMMMSLFVLAETKNRSQTPYTFRKVRTIRDCLEGLALMI